MENKITKLDSEELLEVSGGRENYVKRSWAKRFDPIDLDEGKKDDKDDESNDSREVSIDLKSDDEEDD